MVQALPKTIIPSQSVESDIPRPVTSGLALPIVDMPRPAIPYPVINVPTQEEFDAAVKAEKEKHQEEKSKERDRKSTRLNSSHIPLSRMPSSA